MGFKLIPYSIHSLNSEFSHSFSIFSSQTKKSKLKQTLFWRPQQILVFVKGKKIEENLDEVFGVRRRLSWEMKRFFVEKHMFHSKYKGHIDATSYNFQRNCTLRLLNFWMCIRSKKLFFAENWTHKYYNTSKLVNHESRACPSSLVEKKLSSNLCNLALKIIMCGNFSMSHFYLL